MGVFTSSFTAWSGTSLVLHVTPLTMARHSRLRKGQSVNFTICLLHAQLAQPVLTTCQVLSMAQQPAKCYRWHSSL